LCFDKENNTPSLKVTHKHLFGIPEYAKMHKCSNKIIIYKDVPEAVDPSGKFTKTVWCVDLSSMSLHRRKVIGYKPLLRSTKVFAVNRQLIFLKCLGAGISLSLMYVLDLDIYRFRCYNFRPPVGVYYPVYQMENDIIFGKMNILSIGESEPRQLRINDTAVNVIIPEREKASDHILFQLQRQSKQEEVVAPHPQFQLPTSSDLIAMLGLTDG